MSYSDVEDDLVRPEADEEEDLDGDDLSIAVPDSQLEDPGSCLPFFCSYTSPVIWIRHGLPYKEGYFNSKTLFHLGHFQPKPKFYAIFPEVDSEQYEEFWCSSGGRGEHKSYSPNEMDRSEQ